MEKRGTAMSKSGRIVKISVHALVFLLTVSLIAGLAGFEEKSFATTSTSSPFRNTKSSYQHNGRFDGNVIVHGVDVSYFQSTKTDWVAAKKNQCDFAIMRVTYTTYGNGSLNLDSKFATHFSKAKAAGVMKGVYVFSQAKSETEARKEAQYALNRLKALGIGPKDLELPVYMDYEFAGSSSGRNRGRLYGITKSKAVKCVNAFAEVIRANGYDPGVYANTSFFRNYLGNGVNLASDIDLWCAQYYNRCESPCNYTKWQYSSTARVDGVKFYSTDKEGSTDVDFWYLDRKVNLSPITTIYGNTNLRYTGKPVKPTFAVYAGDKALKEGTDFIVGGINNVSEGTGAYAYIKGIGKYGGYALVPVTIKKSAITHIGLSGVGSGAVAKKDDCKYKIGSDASGNYVRNVSAGTKASTLLGKLKTKGSYKLAVIDANGAKVSGSTVVTTGMMVGVYSGSTLKGTADITVKGNTINDTGANYLCKTNRTAPVAVAAASSAKFGKLDVDGLGGKKTVKALRKFLGVKATGKLKVNTKYRKYCRSVKYIKKGKKDPTIKAMQKWLGVKATGNWNKTTAKALQRKIGVKADGYFGKKSMKALQRYLNNNRY